MTRTPTQAGSKSGTVLRLSVFRCEAESCLEGTRNGAQAVAFYMPEGLALKLKPWRKATNLSCTDLQGCLCLPEILFLGGVQVR